MFKRMTATLLAVAVAVPVLAQSQVVKNQTKVAPTVKMNGFRAEFVADLDEVQEKLTDLAAAMPANKYAWRPGPGVRSVGEVYGHIAGSNYFLATFVGRSAPANIPQDMETITDKARLQSELKKSFDWLRSTIAAESDADLEKTANMFGKQVTHRAVFITILNHLHEHLGQSVAYARMNGVVPPWSR